MFEAKDSADRRSEGREHVYVLRPRRSSEDSRVQPAGKKDGSGMAATG